MQLTGFIKFQLFYYVSAGYAGLVVVHAVSSWLHARLTSMASCSFLLGLKSAGAETAGLSRRAACSPWLLSCPPFMKPRFPSHPQCPLTKPRQVITTRDGYCVSLSNELAAKLRRWRRDPRSCCGRGWSPLIWFLERVGASSARPVGQEYLAPYHMRVGGVGGEGGAVWWVEQWPGRNINGCWLDEPGPMACEIA